MLIREIERQGNWLFRRRSYAPLVLLPFGLAIVLMRDQYLAHSRSVDFWYGVGCLSLSLIGLLVRVLTQGFAQAGSSGRNTRNQIAENLNTTGMYSLCRHPLYLGNLIMAAGVLLFTGNWWFAVSGVLAYFVFYERIMAAEEGYLAARFGATYDAWATRTPALLPNFSLWQRPTLRFSWRAAIKGEFYGLTATITSMFALDAAKVWAVERTFRPVRFWSIALSISLLSFIILRYLRKHSRFFEENERRE